LKTPPPLVTIGMPVFNEGAFLGSALDSLMAQDYVNFEIVISDNCSTDQTSKICLDYAEKFAQIKYKRLPENIGAAANFRFLQENIDGKYFMWAAGHDLWSENLVSKCVERLEESDNAVISFATSNWISKDGEHLSDKESGWCDTRGMNPIARFYTVLWGNMHPILGMIRSESLLLSKPFQSVLGADLILLSELALHGDFVHAVDALWSRRVVREDETYSQRVQRYRSKGYSLIDKRLTNRVPILSLPIELMKVVFRSNLSFMQKVMNSLVLLPTMMLKYLVSR